MVDALALLLQDCALLEDDVLELWGEQCEVFRRKRSQKQIAPARTGAIQFHPQPFSSSEPKPHQRTALDNAPDLPAALVSHLRVGCLCGIRQRCCEMRDLDEMPAQHRFNGRRKIHVISITRRCP